MTSRKILLCTLLLIFLQQVSAVSRILHVSKSDGQDEEGCGNITKQCKTLQYTLLNVYTSKDQLLLDGVTKYQLWYYITLNLNILQDLTIIIKGKAKHKYKPIITSLRGINYMFNHFNATFFLLYMERIEVRYFNLIDSVSLTGLVTLKNCTLKGITRPGLPIVRVLQHRTQKIYNASSLKVVIEQCKIQSYMFFRMKIPFNISITDTEFESGAIQVVDLSRDRMTSSLHLRNMFIHGRVIHIPIVCLGGWVDVRIEDSLFIYTRDPVVVDNTKQLYMTNNLFRNVETITIYIKVNNVSDAKITFNIFQGVKLAETLFHIEKSRVVFSNNSIFDVQSVSTREQQVLHIIDSSISITNTIAENIQGSTVLSTTTRRKQANLKFVRAFESHVIITNMSISNTSFLQAFTLRNSSSNINQLTMTGNQHFTGIWIVHSTVYMNEINLIKSSLSDKNSLKVLVHVLHSNATIMNAKVTEIMLFGLFLPNLFFVQYSRLVMFDILLSRNKATLNSASLGFFDLLQADKKSQGELGSKLLHGILILQSDFLCNNVILQDNSVGISWTIWKSNVQMKDVVIERNILQSPVILINNSSVTMENIQFVDNSVIKKSYGILMNGSQAFVRNVTFERNNGVFTGFKVIRSKLKAIKISFKESRNHRGLECYDKPTLELQDTEFINSSFLFGMIENLDGKAEVRNTYVENVTAMFSLTAVSSTVIVDKFYAKQIDMKAVISVVEGNYVLDMIRIENSSNEFAAIKSRKSDVTLTNSKFINLRGNLLLFDDEMENNTAILLKNIFIHAIDNSDVLLSIAAFFNVQVVNTTIKVSMVSHSKPLVELVVNNRTEYIPNIYQNRTNEINFEMICPSNSLPKQTISSSTSSKYSYYCQPCNKGEYTTEIELSKHSLHLEKYLQNNNSKTISLCKLCPAGGRCDGAIISNDNFWGYKSPSNEVFFLLCPEGYCCSQETIPCTSYQTCDQHRMGILCSKCEKGYQIDYFSNACIETKTCRKSFYFWFVYFSFSCFYVLVLLYLDKIPDILKGGLLKIKHVLCKKKVEKNRVKSDCHLLRVKSIASLVAGSDREKTDGTTLKNQYDTTANYNIDNSFSLNDVKSNDNLQDWSACLLADSDRDKNDEARRKNQYDTTVNCKTNNKSNLSNGNLQDLSTRLSLQDSLEDESGKISGILSVLVSFYQIKSLITISLSVKYEHSYIDSILTDILNLDIIKLPSTFCPVENLDAVTKLYITNFLNVHVMLWFLIILYVLSWPFTYLQKRRRRTADLQQKPCITRRNEYKISKQSNEGVYQFKLKRHAQYQKKGEMLEHHKVEILDDKNPRDTIEPLKLHEVPKIKNVTKSSTTTPLTFNMRLYLVVLKVFLLTYNNMTMFSLKLLNCQQINKQSVLYIYSNIQCMIWWQYAIVVFLLIWIIPLPFALHLSVLMLRKHSIGCKGFLLLLTIPIATPIVYVFMNYWSNFKYQVTTEEKSLEKQIKQLFEEAYKKLDGKVSFTWDAWRLTQRLIIAVFVVFLIDPIYRLGCLIPIMLFLLVVHLYTKPYKHTLVNHLETTSLACLCGLVCVNLFRGFLYVYSLDNQGTITVMVKVYSLLESIFNPVTFLLAYGVYGALSERLGKD